MKRQRRKRRKKEMVRAKRKGGNGRVWEGEKQRRRSMRLGKRAPSTSSHQWTALGVQTPSCARRLTSCSSGSRRRQQI